MGLDLNTRQNPWIKSGAVSGYPLFNVMSNKNSFFPLHLTDFTTQKNPTPLTPNLLYSPIGHDLINFLCPIHVFFPMTICNLLLSSLDVYFMGPQDRLWSSVVLFLWPLYCGLICIVSQYVISVFLAIQNKEFKKKS